MKITKGTQKETFLLETEKGYIFKSITSFDFKTDIVQFVVNNNNDDYGDRFNSLESALLFFNKTFN